MTTAVPVTAAPYQDLAAALRGALTPPAALTMESQMMFLDCPAYLDEHGAQRCGLPAEVKDCFTMRSTSGPIECVKIRCPSGHWFCAPLEFLTWDNTEGPCQRRLNSRAADILPGMPKPGPETPQKRARQPLDSGPLLQGCKTVGLAYVGSNPTPATTCEDSP